MELKGKKIGFIITGAFRGVKEIIKQLKKIKELEADITPIMSIDTKFETAKDYIKEIEYICDKKIIRTIEEVELLEKDNNLDIIVVAPASGTTIAKIVNNIMDTPAAIGVNLHLKNNLPVVITPMIKGELRSEFNKYRKIIK